jgi:hypothetical protein
MIRYFVPVTLPAGTIVDYNSENRRIVRDTRFFLFDEYTMYAENDYDICYDAWCVVKEKKDSYAYPILLCEEDPSVISIAKFDTEPTDMEVTSLVDLVDEARRQIRYLGINGNVFKVDKFSIAPVENVEYVSLVSK